MDKGIGLGVGAGDRKVSSSNGRKGAKLHKYEVPIYQISAQFMAFTLIVFIHICMHLSIYNEAFFCTCIHVSIYNEC